ncbi:hypothetical protein Tco_1318277 [Tanacetum coccineum]
MVMEKETKWWQQWGGDDGVDLVAVVGGVVGWMIGWRGEDGGDVVDVGLGWMVVGVAAAVAGNARDSAGNLPKREKGDGRVARFKLKKLSGMSFYIKLL